MEFKGTPGKFVAHTEVAQWYSFDNRFFEVTDEKNQIIAFVKDWNGAGEQPKYDAKLLAAAPELLEALNKAADYMWEDTRMVRFDPTMIFGCGYDFDGWDDFREELHTKIGSFAVWKTGVRNEYYAYGGADGIFWNDGFKSKQDARDAVISYITKLDPSHPAVIANHAIRKALGGE